MCFLVTLHFIKISFFLIFLIISLPSYTSTIIYFLSSSSEYVKKKKTKCKINIIGVNLKVCYKFTQSLYSKPINLHGYIWANVGHFCEKLCKFHTFFYYTVIDVSALTMGKKKYPFSISYIGFL